MPPMVVRHRARVDPYAGSFVSKFLGVEPARNRESSFIGGTRDVFNSLEGGYVPICIATVFAAWFLSGLPSVLVRVVSACLVPFAISLAWYFLPAAIMSDGGDGWIGWGVIAAGSWSAIAVPLGIVATLGLSMLRKRLGGRLN
jgi:hypothetical protein